MTCDIYPSYHGTSDHVTCLVLRVVRSLWALPVRLVSEGTTTLWMTRTRTAIFQEWFAAIGWERPMAIANYQNLQIATAGRIEDPGESYFAYPVHSV